MEALMTMQEKELGLTAPDRALLVILKRNDNTVTSLSVLFNSQDNLRYGFYDTMEFINAHISSMIGMFNNVIAYRSTLYALLKDNEGNTTYSKEINFYGKCKVDNVWIDQPID